ncbi:MAG: nucleotidyltransferase domain-containing protein [Gammaproteobacteria bacterium]
MRHRPLSPAFRLAALLSLEEPSAPQIKSIRELLEEVKDFEDLNAKIDQFRTWGFVHRNIQRCDLSVPVEFYSSLKDKSRQILMTNLLLEKETERLRSRLSESGIGCIVLKGAPLAKTIYSHAGLRHAKDIDLLVPSHQLAQAGHYLERSGYRCHNVELTGTANQSWIRRHYHDSHYENEHGVVVELHWRLFNDRRILPVDQRIWTTRYLAGRSFRLPDDELLLYLCWHGSLHYWERLKWLSDIAQLVKSDRWNWDALIGKAEASNSLRPLLLGLLLSHLVFENLLPEPVKAAIKSEPMAMQLADDVISNAFNKTGCLNIETPDKRATFKSHILRLLFNLKLSASPAYKLHCLLTPLLPGINEFRLIRLPHALFFIYFVLRPLRILRDQLPFRRIRTTSTTE